jgi:hypothetical protein
VVRLSEVVTETIDVSQLQESVEREVKLSIGTDHVWVEQEQRFTVKIAIEPVPGTDDTAGGGRGGEGAG